MKDPGLGRELNEPMQVMSFWNVIDGQTNATKKALKYPVHPLVQDIIKNIVHVSMPTALYCSKEFQDKMKYNQ